MKVEVSSSGIPGIADVGDHISASHLLSLDDPICIAREMRIVINVAAGWIDLIERYPTPLALKQFEHSAVRRGKN